MAIGGYPTSYILGNTQTVSIGTSSAQSTAVSGKLNVYRIIGSCDSHIEFGVNPTATTSSAMLPAYTCLLYTSPSPRDATLSRMPSSA